MNPQILIALAIAAASALGGWTANGWRFGAEIQALKAEHSKTIADAQAEANKRLITLVNERDAKATRISAIDAKYTAQLSKARNENKTLADRLADGSVRLRIAASCPDSTAEGTGTAQGSSVDSGAGAILEAPARLAYTALVDGIITTENTLAACQKSLAEFQ
jgi:prophage endopeptidase